MKNVLLLLFSFVVFSCRNEKTDPVPAQKYPVEVVKTESYNAKTTTSRFIYNADRRLIREDILLENVPDTYKLYDYDASGKLTTVSYYDTKNVMLEQNYLAYNASGQLERFSHAYIDASGKKNFHHYRDFNYETDGRISRVQDFSPGGSLQKTLTITDASNSKALVEERDAANILSLRSISTFDGKFHPLNGTGINFLSQLRPGNEVSNNLYDAAGKEIVSWTKSISYNAWGYPLKIVQTYSNGVIKTETYTYSSLN